MKHKSNIFIIVGLILFYISASAQNQEKLIDSLVNKLRTAGREWNNYANPLIEIGEPAVPALIKNAENKSLEQWNRRISAMTLNQIHSEKWKEAALKILYDENEDPAFRNQVTGGLKGFNLVDEKEKLWELYNNSENQFYKSNLAGLLLTADSTYAYQAFYELYTTQDGHIQKNALLQLTKLKPEESTYWYLNAIQEGSWITGNLAMDSLVTTNYFNARELINVYSQSVNNETVQWRIVYIFGHRKMPESLSFLLEALKNKNWLVNNEAAVGLSRFEPDLVLPMIEEFKRDSMKFMRQNAKWVIENLKTE